MSNFIVNDQNPNSRFRKLLDLIPDGEDNAIPMKTLAYLMNMDCRQIRRAVKFARFDGNVIAGGDKGYYVPSNLVELQGYFNRSVARIRTSGRSLNAVKARLKQEEMNVDD